MRGATTHDDILQIGDPRLRERASAVADVADPAVRADGARVHGALMSYRERWGYGRGTAATQLGIPRRIIALHMPDWPELVYNPEFTWKSPETFTLWENCMSFPFMLVRTRRHRSVSLRYLDAAGDEHLREGVEMEIAELMQHEMDHLDGTLGVDRAIDGDAIVARKTFEADREHYLAQVDYRANNDKIPPIRS
jgi:peptide deformylase